MYNHMANKIKILWLYPSVLNLHGDRGNLMALVRIGAMLGVEVEIIRAEDVRDPLPLDEAAAIFITPGQVKDVLALAPQMNRMALADFADQGGLILAIGSSGCLLAKETVRYDGSICKGLDLLPMTCQERDAVYGDDIWFHTSEGMEILGNQIQVINTFLAENAQPFGIMTYGYGNNGGKDEGCRSGNIIFTNTLGPMLVKNPRFTAELLTQMCQNKGIDTIGILAETDTEYEDESARYIRAFIKKKMA